MKFAHSLPALSLLPAGRTVQGLTVKDQTGAALCLYSPPVESPAGGSSEGEGPSGESDREGRLRAGFILFWFSDTF